MLMNRCTQALIVAAVSASVACSSEKPAQVASAPQMADPRPSAKEPTPEQVAPKGTAKHEARTQGEAPPTDIEPIGEPGRAYFCVDGTGLVKLDKTGAFSVISDEPEMIKDFAQAGEKLFIASSRGVHVLEGDALKQIGDFESPGLVDAIAADEKGTVWATSFKGISHFDGKKWTTRAKSALGSDVKLLADVAVSEDGSVWVASSNGLHKKTDSGFERIALPKTSSRLFLKHFAISPKGQLYVTHSRGILRVGADSVEPLDLPGLGNTVELIGVGPDEAFHVSTTDVIALARDQKIAKYSAASGQFKGKRIMALDVDGRGRTWAATDHGVVIIEPSGEVIQWAPGTIPELGGAVQALIVLGTGPKLPKVGPQRFGGVTGKIIKDGVPQAAVAVEICARPSMMFRTTPCDDAPFKASAKTGPKGSFTFKKVPVGTYRFAIKPGDKWTVTLSGCCSKMKEGQIFDVGSIDLSK